MAENWEDILKIDISDKTSIIINEQLVYADHCYLDLQITFTSKLLITDKQNELKEKLNELIAEVEEKFVTEGVSIKSVFDFVHALKKLNV